jgi:hypothetical protein
MSRFEKFQGIRVQNIENEPLTEQIFIHDCIINFENGYINNLDNEAENETYPAIDCIDAHIEYWENGVLNRHEKPAVISAGDNKIEFWENGKLSGDGKYYPNHSIGENRKVGNEAEDNFAEYLNENNIPFIHLDQRPKEQYSKVFMKKYIKRPDYIVFMDKKPLFIDVKAKGCYTINNDELVGLNNMENEYSIDVIFAIIDRGEIESNKFSFILLDTMTDYVKIIKNKIPNCDWEIYPMPKTLLNTGMVFNKTETAELEKIFYKEKGQYIKNKYHFSDALQEHLKTQNYMWCRMSDTNPDQTFKHFPIV